MGQWRPGGLGQGSWAGWQPRRLVRPDVDGAGASVTNHAVCRLAGGRITVTVAQRANATSRPRLAAAARRAITRLRARFKSESTRRTAGGRELRSSDRNSSPQADQTPAGRTSKIQRFQSITGTSPRPSGAPPSRWPCRPCSAGSFCPHRSGQKHKIGPDIM
jgi:hypothetical protein